MVGTAPARRAARAGAFEALALVPFGEHLGALLERQAWVDVGDA